MSSCAAPPEVAQAPARPALDPMIGTLPVRALIFDFDGVLADTEDLHYAAFQSALATVGLTFSRQAYYGQFLGLPDRDCVAAVCAQAGVATDAGLLETLVARKRERFAVVSQTTGVYPGAAEALHRLHAHFVLAVASGAFHDEIEAILGRANLRALFAAIVGAEDVRAGKPAPDPFLEALRQIAHRLAPPLTARDCVVVEDSPRGVTAAHAAGMRCVAVTTNHDRAALAAADAVIDHLGQLRPEDVGG